VITEVVLHLIYGAIVGAMHGKISHSARTGLPAIWITCG